MRASRRAAVKTVDIDSQLLHQKTDDTNYEFFLLQEYIVKLVCTANFFISPLLNIGALCFAGIPSITALSLFPHTDFTFLWPLLVLQFFNHNHIMCVNIK